MKEEEVDFNPDIEEETDIVGDFLGVEVETCDLLGIEESGQPSSSTLPDNIQGAALGAPLEESCRRHGIGFRWAGHNNWGSRSWIISVSTIKAAKDEGCTWG